MIIIIMTMEMYVVCVRLVWHEEMYDVLISKLEATRHAKRSDGGEWKSKWSRERKPGRRLCRDPVRFTFVTQTYPPRTMKIDPGGNPAIFYITNWQKSGETEKKYIM